MPTRKDIERLWVCPICHWMEWYPADTEDVLCLEHHRLAGRNIPCVEYVPIGLAQVPQRLLTDDIANALTRHV